MTNPEAPTSEGLGDEAAMGALFDKLTADGVEEETPDVGAAEAAPEVATPEETPPAPVEAAEEPKPQPVEAPTDLPAAVKAEWAAMSETAREAVLRSHRELNNRLAETGRVASAARPIYDVVVKAAQEMPALASMTPAQIAADVFELARTADALTRDPVGTLLKVAEQRGALEGLKQAIAGQQATDTTPALLNEIRSLKAQLAQVADPNALEQRVLQTLTTRETERVVSEYAAKADHWSAVESVMPNYVQIAQARLGAGASAKDVLDAAYDMAIHADPTIRAKVTAPAPKPQPTPDPAKVAAQMAAKSVNVASKSTGATRPMTDRQRMESVWDKFAQS